MKRQTKAQAAALLQIEQIRGDWQYRLKYIVKADPKDDLDSLEKASERCSQAELLD